MPISSIACWANMQKSVKIAEEKIPPPPVGITIAVELLNLINHPYKMPYLCI